MRTVFLLSNGHLTRSKQMKKILIAGFASTLAIGFAPAAVFAATISNTGPGSYNSIINESTKEITVTCNNNVEVVNINNQSSNSGTAVVNGNNYGGDAQSGDAQNLNEFVATLGVSCAPVVAAVTPPPAGGQGGGTPAPAVLASSTTLPDTGSEMILVGAATAFVLGTASAIATKKLVDDEN
jgi:hypothetical protein